MENCKHCQFKKNFFFFFSNSDAEIKQFYAKKSLGIRRYEAASLSVLKEQMLLLLLLLT